MLPGCVHLPKHMDHRYMAALLLLPLLLLQVVPLGMLGMLLLALLAA